MTRNKIGGALALILLAVLGLTGLIGLAAADRPTSFPFFLEFEDVNPCTGNVVTVTVTGTSFVHFHSGRVVIHNEKVVATDDGFIGRGTDTIVDNGKIFKFTLNDVLTDGSGDRLRAHIVFVFNGQTGSVQVVKGGIPVRWGP